MTALTAVGEMEAPQPQSVFKNLFFYQPSLFSTQQSVTIFLKYIFAFFPLISAIDAQVQNLKCLYCTTLSHVFLSV